jgi:hypothetical protein
MRLFWRRVKWGHPLAAGEPVFNRTVTLKDSWSKAEK